ncbi:hypothetical protein KK083_04250 [Fulvivirgaceae bacterium PWU4]|uniref:Sensor histidine kinase n=1 Tax=Chryseosolibacter histidini TaxID=2782349 RepID=A0AAP2DH03_9BACT|nr:hypothetical protein [Chryseosolibacter histidini]MBT1696075.1 hypothetical protein [Chryseosolibacter histidini]
MKYIIKKLTEQIFSNIPFKESCIESCSSINQSKVVDCPTFNEKRRCGVYHKGGLEIYLCSRENIKSKRLFSDSIEIITNFAIEIDGSKKIIQQQSFKQVERLIHNLKTYNAHCIQLVELMLDPSIARKHINEQISSIEAHILENPRRAAKSLINLLKNSKLIQSEISIYDSLFKSDTSNFRIGNHQIHRLLKGVLMIFFEDFQEKNIRINLQDSSLEIAVDYPTFICALIHFFDNATKYVFPESSVDISFADAGSKICVHIEMISLRINQDEKDKILEEGQSGFFAKKLNLNGKGIGMFVIATFFELNNSKLIINPKVKSSTREKFGIPYDINEFILELPKSGGLFKMM